MAKKTVITKVLEANTYDGIIEVSQNRTLYVDQFTAEPPYTDKEKVVFHPRNINDVFDHYCPYIEYLSFENEDGICFHETFYFRNINDFYDEEIIRQSEYLSRLNQLIKTSKKVISLLNNDEVTTHNKIKRIINTTPYGFFKKIKLWCSLLKDKNKTIEELRLKYNKILDKATSSLHKNLCYIHGKIRNLKKAYLSLDLYFKNCDSNVNHLYIMNIDKRGILDYDSEDTLSIENELKNNYDRSILGRKYSFLVIPGYIKSINAIKRWAKTAYKYKVMLITDFEDSLNFDILQAKLEKEPLHGDDIYLSNTAVLCNYVKGLNYPASCDDDLYLPASTSFAGRITSLDNTICGNINGTLRGIAETHIKNLNNVQIGYLESNGLMPVLNVNNNVYVDSKRTLGELDFLSKRAIDWLTIVIQNMYKDYIFYNWNTSTRCEIHVGICDFMDAYKIPKGFIADYKIKEISRNDITLKCNIVFSIKFFDHSSNNYEIKIISHSSISGIDWNTEITTLE